MEVCQPWSADDLRRSATRSRLGDTMNRQPFRLGSYALYETTVQLPFAGVVVRRSHALDPITAAPRSVFAALLAIDFRSGAYQLSSRDASESLSRRRRGRPSEVTNFATDDGRRQIGA